MSLSAQVDDDTTDLFYKQDIMGHMDALVL